MIVDKKALPFIVITPRTDVDPITKVKHYIEAIDTSAFDAKLFAHLADRALHRGTIGVPAPWPEDERLRSLAESIERGEQLQLTHDDQVLYDWDAAIATDKALKLPAPTSIVQSDPPSLWSRMVDAYNVLTGKVTLP